MAEEGYDGSIRIKAKIVTDEAGKDLAEIAERVEILKDKLNSLEKSGAGKNNHEYRKTADELSQWSKKLAEVSTQQGKATAATNYFKREIDKYKSALAELEGKGLYFGDQEYDDAYAALQRLQALLKVYQKDLISAAGSENKFRTEIARVQEQVASLSREGFGVGDPDYDKAYIDLQNLIQAEKQYKKLLSTKTDTAQADALRKEEAARAAARAKEEAAKEAARRKEEAAVNKIMAQEEQKRAKEAAGMYAREQEQIRLQSLRESATVTDERVIALLERKKELEREINELAAAGVQYGYQEYDMRQKELATINEQVNSYAQNITAVGSMPGKVARVKEAVNGVSSVLTKANNMINAGLKKISTAAKKAFGTAQKETRKLEGLTSILWHRFRGLALSLLIFNWISKGWAAMISGMKKSLDSLAQTSDEYEQSVQTLRNSLSTLSNSLASAFAPIIQTAVPYLVQLINWINAAVNALAQLYAYLSGKSTWKKATQVQAGYAGSLNDTAAAAKKAYGALAKFDDLDVLDKKDTSGGAGGGGSTGGYEEVPISKDIKKLGDKLKKIFKGIFTPLKKAWDREGVYVITSWKYALGEIRNLAQDIGRDFLRVWNEDATVDMLADVLHILGDIGQIIGNIAMGLDDAWIKNETGYHILQNIRDIIAEIVGHIRSAADYTVDWSKNLDFSPLFMSFEEYTESLIPVVDSLYGILEDFYKDVLLPLSKWTIEKGLPDFFDILTAFNDKVDWSGIRKKLKEFWQHLEPFAETVGEGLLIFIGDLSHKLADFVNSEKFDDFLANLEEWMDSVTPEDVAHALEIIAKSIVVLKLAIVGFDVAKGIFSFYAFVKLLLAVFGAGGKAAGAAGAINEVAASTVGMSAALSGLGGAIAYFLSTANPGMLGEISLQLENLLHRIIPISDVSTWKGRAAEVEKNITWALEDILDFTGQALLGSFLPGLKVYADAKDKEVEEMIMLPQSLMVGLASQGPEIMEAFRKIYASVKNGHKASVDELKSMFRMLGLELPDELIRSLSHSDSLVQQRVIDLLGMISGGEEVSEAKLRELFAYLGISLPMELCKSLNSKGPEVIESVLEILTKLKDGEKLSEKELLSVFENLGIGISDSLIKSIAASNQSVQNAVIEMIANIQTGKDISAEGLQETFSQFGIDIPNWIITALKSQDGPAHESAIRSLQSMLTATDSERAALLGKNKTTGEDSATALSGGYAAKLDSDTTATDATKGFFDDVSGEIPTEEDWSGEFADMPAAFQSQFKEMQTWYNDEALPAFWAATESFFSIDRFLTMFDNIRQAAVTKYDEIMTWWVDEAMTGWMENNVTPYFTIEKWLEMFKGMPDALKQTVEDWKKHWNTEIPAWMAQSKAEQFSKSKWMVQLLGVMEAFKQTLKDWKEHWAETIVQWMADTKKEHFSKEKWIDNLKGMRDGFHFTLDDIRSYAEECFAAIGDSCAALISQVDELLSKIAQLADAEMPHGVTTTGSSGAAPSAASFRSFPRIDVPALASGSVIRGGNPFLAILGDQPAGQLNLEAPAGLISEMVEKGVAAALRGNVSTGSASMPANITLNLDGQEFARLTLQDFLGEMNRQGYDVKILGVN